MIRRAPAAAVLLLLAACAGAQRGGGDRCDQAFSHADGLLRAGLAEYVTQMKRYAAARDPEVTTAAAEARVQEKAEAWTSAHRAPTVKECRAWPEERLVCVLGTRHASELGPCGLDALVRSFTDEVVADFAAKPFDVPKRE